VTLAKVAAVALFCTVAIASAQPVPSDYAICPDEACTAPLILPHCPYEDSDNCMWDARHRGNGKGQSFYVIDGVVTFIDLEDDGF